MSRPSLTSPRRRRAPRCDVGEGEDEHEGAAHGDIEAGRPATAERPPREAVGHGGASIADGARRLLW